MRALIIDDEKRARESIARAIQLYTPQVTVVGEAAGVQTAVAAIKKQQPDLLFLDIRLKDGNGFDILGQIPTDGLAIIFVTAYSEYAIKALKISAIDYILKPIDADELVLAVDKAAHRLKEQKLEARVALFLEQIESKEPIKRITLKTVDSIHIIVISDIVYCQGDRSYTTFYLSNHKEIMVSKNLREYEGMLPMGRFIRTHQSYLVNLDHIVKYDKSNNVILTTNNYNIPVSTRKKEALLEALKNLK
ncbi:LytR/AlgR family response regulator transcription factor [Aureispira anguillae]|uniref:LytTR family DNA-binding domain-containing protein n=1 Tax=Aureispira anguillae TaxID=2864201 RepID=A0A915YKH4_9BACT|nr:LytTR family DNA-binding domain-containing protein [Aureispira anguillae]BDS14463.1 LytTR family DNA-binding domain-containing protein [Aureispira anguillae]